MNYRSGRTILSASTLAKAIRTCTISIVLMLSLTSANTDALLRHLTVERQILSLYNSAAAHTVLASTTSTTTCASVVGTFSCHESFSGGDIYWSQSTGAVYVANGPLRDHWLSSGGPTGPFGLPSGNPTPVPGKGSTQTFTTGTLLYTPATGTHEFMGAIRTKWLTSGTAGGPLGFPTTNEYSSGHGRAQKFQNGIIYSSPSSGTHITTRGEIESRFIALGGPTGRLGFPAGEQISTGNGWAQRFANGYLVTGPTGSAKIVDPDTYKNWAANPERLGWPVKDSWVDDRGIHTAFQRIETIWDPQTKALYSAATVDKNTAIIIGDSQLAGDSWTEQGARAAGFPKKIELGFGGWGYTRTTPATGGTPDDVFSSLRILLPQGNPGAIFMTLGGNDASSNATDQDIIAHATKTWAELHRLYPKSTLIINGVMSTNAPNHTNRRHVDQVITQAAKSQGFIHISVAGMATTASNNYKDNVHLNQTGNNLVALTYTATLIKALGK
ncbi:hypothetical protein AS189_09510 [Arthrobacter alpinus]|uniref:SGNH hydrolase-type esterase domain-containing protein n=1 Tax=Arthrobacter alpinus TaxID=656366 RepID=A0A0S2LZB5_9MICC|nr:GDSL-type esterase/lipase family protein [Arthrobacter alpinus]ALO66689.1 hypothetical protein AS189_09510 [Arthrobacter alpinus]